MDVLAAPADRHKGWYLPLMAPNTKGPSFAWLDPSRLYCNSQAFGDCVKDLLIPFHSDSIDLVAGIDAMGFILGMRLLLVDQWVETGGTMKAAIQLVERLGATVVGQW
ncbi:Adenine phosphoribosyltransferase [Liparis tanakae]|uniref:adenine phosphoribosyltransferase n=1 Tax=Liparis tanakae TaxID=230148 RepID=A0A4Z2HA11_9TELE|nr:Adenine phosphoribosyltransferase [Liparis tanakae]